MACLYKNCKITNENERFITCWLCENHGHFKCAGFTGRQFDVITDRKNGLRWACINCRSLEVDFYRLFKESKVEIANMKKDFESVYSRLNYFENMYNKFEYPDGSPKRKKSSAIISGNNLISLNSPVVAPLQNNTENLSSVNHLAPPLQFASSPCSRSSPAVSNTSESRSTQIETLSSEAPSNVQQNPHHLHSVPPIFVSDYTSNPTAHPPMQCASLPSSSLIVVPPRKSVFISRLHPSTTINNISDYVKSKIHNLEESDFKIFKFNSSSARAISSFKLVVSKNIFDTIINSSFWPDDILVKEFVFREKRNALNPVRTSNAMQASKN